MCMSSGPRYTPPPPPPAPKEIAPEPRMGNKSDIEDASNGTTPSSRTKRKGSRNDLVIDLAPGVGSSSGLNIPS